MFFRGDAVSIAGTIIYSSSDGAVSGKSEKSVCMEQNWLTERDDKSGHYANGGKHDILLPLHFSQL